jgi:putative addiction module component (TIGR02574 family)
MSDQAVSCYTASMVEMHDIARLTPEERLELIGRLWDSLESEDVRLTPSQDAELGRRMATFDADAKTAVLGKRSRPISFGGPHECCAFGSPPTRGRILTMH